MNVRLVAILTIVGCSITPPKERPSGLNSECQDSWDCGPELFCLTAESRSGMSLPLRNTCQILCKSDTDCAPYTPRDSDVLAECTASSIPTVSYCSFNRIHRL